MANQRVTRVSLQIAVDESAFLGQTGEWAGAPNLVSGWDALSPTTGWVGRPELVSGWYAPPAAATDWNGDPELRSAWTVNLSPQLGGWYGWPEVRSEWETELSTVGSWRGRPTLRSQWLFRLPAVGTPCLTGDGAVIGEVNYVF
jgi:hypothetical protein